MASPSGSRVSSEHEPDFNSEQTPARLSALYQYHNAPEVAPAHGLEYDDTVYPVSDKFPVVRETRFGGNMNVQYTGKHAFDNDNRPPRIIFGMKVKTFLIVAVVMLLVVVGAAVGGAVGGKDLHRGVPGPGNYGDMSGTGSSSSAAAPTATPTSTSATTYSAATPTYTPLTGCPADLDGTTYTSQYATSSSDDSGLKFTMHCNTQSPLAASGAQQLLSAFVYSFADCTEICAGFNVQSTNSTCSFAAYKPAAARPANCWVGSSSNLTASLLKTSDGTELALLQSP